MKDEKTTVKDQIGSDLFKQLTSKKAEWKKLEEGKRQEEQKRRKEEQKRKEANKSFEELLDESQLDWKRYK